MAYRSSSMRGAWCCYKPLTTSAAFGLGPGARIGLCLGEIERGNVRSIDYSRNASNGNAEITYFLESLEISIGL